MLKPGGKLAIFHGMDNRQIIAWGQNNGIPIKTIDLLETHKKLWCNVFNEIITMSRELRAEIPETYRRIKGECIEVIENDGWLPRWL